MAERRGNCWWKLNVCVKVLLLYKWLVTTMCVRAHFAAACGKRAERADSHLWFEKYK